MAIFVYCFECISECKAKGRRYIGSTENLKLRYFYHLKGFKERTHHNPELMKWYNKKNIKFKFYILERVLNKSQRFEREQFYIDKYMDNCFNLVDVNGKYLKKPKRLPLKDLRLNIKRTNKQQRAIKKFIKSCKRIHRFY